jgi:predicted kinase
MCGFSGSGKSFVSEQLVEFLPAIRIRSDVERKRIAGLGKLEKSSSDIITVASGIYTPSYTESVYHRMLDIVKTCLVFARRNIVIDAAFLREEKREMFKKKIAECEGARFAIVLCTAKGNNFS